MFKAIVCGGSAGGFESLENFIKELPSSFSIPIIVVLHIGQEGGKYFATTLKRFTSLAVKEPKEKESISPGNIYIAPPNYHLLIEEDATFSYSLDEKICYSRPSIDVLFTSAADAFGISLIGILLSGANNDGSDGIAYIKELGGMTIVEDPNTAKFKTMPLAAINKTSPTHILSSYNIASQLVHTLSKGRRT